MLPVAITLPVPKLLTLALPLAFNVPDMLAPVPVITIVALPAELMLTLPDAVGILTFDVPFDIELMPVS